MSQKTIRAQLVASESSRQAIWELMAERNTPLINALLEQIAASPGFEEACSKSSISQATVKDCCQKLREDPQFSGQPGRFYTSAILTVSRIFKSWIRIRSQILYRLEGQTRWLLILQSDEELTKACDCNLEAIQNKAAEVLRLHPKPLKLRSALLLKKANLPKSQKQKRANSTSCLSFIELLRTN